VRKADFKEMTAENEKKTEHSKSKNDKKENTSTSFQNQE